MARRRNRAWPTPTTEVWPLSDEQWCRIAVAINPDRSIADDAKLPNGRSLRDGFERAISFLVGFGLAQECATAREVRADLRRFVLSIVKAYRAMCPTARALFNSVDGLPYFRSDMKEAVLSVRPKTC